jgi:hypothetical protein
MNRLEYLTQEELKDLHEVTLQIMERRLSPQCARLWHLRCDCPGPARNSIEARDKLLVLGKKRRSPFV